MPSPAPPRAVPARGLRFAQYIKAAAALGAVALLGLLAWRLSAVFVVAFGGMVVAAVLAELAGLAERFTPLRGAWARAVSWLLFALLLAGFVWLLGARLAAELAALGRQLPGLVDDLGRGLGLPGLWDRLWRGAADLADDGQLLGHLATYSTLLVNAVAGLLLVLVSGVFLAIDPALYRRGLVLLVPDPYAGPVDRGLAAAGRALRLWLVGKVITMLVVGVATGAALFMLKIPSALALGLIAGIFEFIPFVGPVLGAVPGLLVAMPMGWDTLAWVAVAYFAIQQLESNILIPLVQRRTAQLPPVLGLLSILAFGILFGLAGVVLATPLTIVCMVLVQQLYVREGLGRQTRLPGESSSSAAG